MGRTRGMRYVAAAAVAVLATVAGVAWLVRGRPSTDAHWRVLPGAFDAEQTWQVGPRVLVADDPCYVAFGTASTGAGMRPATWRADGDCLAPSRTDPTYRQPGDGPPTENRAGIMAAVAVQGGYLALSRTTFHGDAYAYETSVLRCRSDGECTRLALFSDGRDGHIGPVAVANVEQAAVEEAAVEEAYVAVGHHDAVATAWTSPDAVTWRETPLPGSTDGAAVRALAVGAGRVVAVGDAQRQPVAWVSNDGGSTWVSAHMPTTADGPTLWTVVFDGVRFVALGGVDGPIQAPAIVLTSADGLTWERERVPDGMYQVTHAVATRSGAVVAVAAADTPSGHRLDTLCASAWVRSGAGWHSEAVGCHGVPDAIVELSDGRLAAAYWSTLFVRDPLT